MKKLLTLTLISTLFVSCNVQEIELGLADALEKNNLLSASCSLSDYAEPAGATYTNISSSFEPTFSISSSTDLINEGISSDASTGKCSVIKQQSSCPTCKSAPQYSVEYVGAKGQDSDSCSLNDGTIVTIDLSDKNNPSCSANKLIIAPLIMMGKMGPL